METNLAFLAVIGLVGFAVLLSGLLLISGARNLAARRSFANEIAKRAREAALVAEAVGYLREGRLTARWILINLLRGEECYHATPCSYETVARQGWYQLGGETEIDVLDVASYPPLPSRSVLPIYEANSGQLYVTNQRLVFVGDAKSVSFGWGNIFDVTPYSNGLRLDLGHERYAVFRTGDARAAALSRALVERHAQRRGIRTA